MRPCRAHPALRTTSGQVLQRFQPRLAAQLLGGHGKQQWLSGPLHSTFIAFCPLDPRVFGNKQAASLEAALGQCIMIQTQVVNDR